MTASPLCSGYLSGFLGSRSLSVRGRLRWGAESYAKAAIGSLATGIRRWAGVGQELWLDCQAGVFPLSDRFAEMD